jgi:peptidoglycan/LPS O-acetylase OafA/YrhL
MSRDIQALREIAVFGILLYQFDEKLFELGYLGVDDFL